MVIILSKNNELPPLGDAADFKDVANNAKGISDDANKIAKKSGLDKTDAGKNAKHAANDLHNLKKDLSSNNSSINTTGRDLNKLTDDVSKAQNSFKDSPMGDYFSAPKSNDAQKDGSTNEQSPNQDIVDTLSGDPPNGSNDGNILSGMKNAANVIKDNGKDLKKLNKGKLSPEDMFKDITHPSKASKPKPVKPTASSNNNNIISHAKGALDSAKGHLGMLFPKTFGALGGLLNLAQKGVKKASKKLGFDPSDKTTGILARLGLSSPIIIILIVLGFALFDNNNQTQTLLNDTFCGIINDSKKAIESAETGLSGGAVGGEWTKSGTKANKTAKEVWNYWKGKGMNGAQIAGIVGNIGGAEDKGFVLDQRELSGGSGGGLYQFTPYTKYLEDSKSDKSWSVKNQGDVIMHTEPQTVAAYFKKTKHSSPDDCATDWMNMYERPSPTARQSTNGARRAAAMKAYKIFGGSSVKGKDSLLGAASSAASVGQNADTKAAGGLLAQCQSGSKGGGLSNSGDVLKNALKLVGYFTYSQSNRTDIGGYPHPTMSSLKKSGHTDCSGFVWTVLKVSGYKVPAQMWATGAMESDAKGSHHYLKEIKPSEAGPGDIVVVNVGDGGGDGGHTAILTSKWHGKTDATKIVQEGGRTDREHVNRDGFRSSFLSLLGAGRVTLCRPIK